MPRKLEDLTGQVFSRLTVLERDLNRKMWECRCACGNITYVTTTHLKADHTKSCGCFKKEMYAEGSRKEHGMTGTPIHNIWCGMIQRCRDKNIEPYRNYGGRGISVCSEWQDFENFYKDMYPAYKKGLTIERIDVNGNYCKENCCWIPRNEQSKNTRKTAWVNYGGEKTRLNDLCKKLKINRNSVYSRLSRGWSIDKAIETPFTNEHRMRVIIVDGIADNLANMCRRYGVKYQMVLDRLLSGWPAERALKQPKAKRFEAL